MLLENRFSLTCRSNDFFVTFWKLIHSHAVTPRWLDDAKDFIQSGWNKQHGCLPFVRINRLGRVLNNGKGFPKISKQTNEMSLTICTSISRNCFQLMRDGKLESLANGKEFPPFRSEQKKRSASEGTPQFPNGISRKLPYHLTSNWNFRIFSPNGKHLMTLAPWQRKSQPWMLVASKAVFLKKYLACSTWILNGSSIECLEKSINL